MTTVGFIGSGNIGSALARLAVKAGHQVVRHAKRTVPNTHQGKE
jgi:predicted dinucleotide-binding enzyme